MDTFETYTTYLPLHSRQKSSIVAGATLHSAIYPTIETPVHDDLISFLSYAKSHEIPLLPVSKPDIRSGLGEGASFLVNGAEMPEKYHDHVSGVSIPRGTIVAFKRAKLNPDMEDPSADRIRAIFNEVITMRHPPLLAHPNIVQLLGIGFETEGPSDAQNVMPVIVPECAELGNLAEVLEIARKEDRPLSFDVKLSLCLDVAYGLEILHACDIVHGDVKCENILVFDRDERSLRHDKSQSPFICKMTDFGVSRLPGEAVLLGGSRPWQAPECSRGAYFKIEEAKRTDIYSFGMLVWRTFLDGDPFKLLGEFQGSTSKIRRENRNQAVADLKENDQLVQHVCKSLALSDRFTRVQLEMLCEVVEATLAREPAHRELDVTRLIRLLSKNQWYEARHPVAPARIPLDIDAHFLDLEKWWHEFARVSPVVHSLIVTGLLESIHESPDEHFHIIEDHKVSASYQLALCYANGIGVSFSPKSCMEWLSFAANNGSVKASQVQNKIAEALEITPTNFSNPWTSSHETIGIDTPFESISGDDAQSDVGMEVRSGGSQSASSVSDKEPSGISFLGAAEGRRYSELNSLLSAGIKPPISEDGVSPLHFASSWDITQAKDLIPQLIKAGADIDAIARRGPTVGGTPLMWSLHEDHVQHSKLLLQNGANPLVCLADGENALSLAARTHSTSHLRMFLTYVRAVEVQDRFSAILEGCLSGVSRFARLVRHGSHWKTSAVESLSILKDWDILYSGVEHFNEALMSALEHCVSNAYTRMNTDVQIAAIRTNKLDAILLGNLLRESVLHFNKELFIALLEYGVPVDGTFDQEKSLLHLCAKIPDHSVAAADFAPLLLARGGDLEARDVKGLTPWMDAILERKWDLADLLMKAGADPLAVDNESYNIMGLCIKAINVGSIKYLLKYCAKHALIQEQAFIVNPKLNISALQLAASLQLPRAHGMKLEVLGVFFNIFPSYGIKPEQRHHRSGGLYPDILPHATALDIAAVRGNVYAVKNLVKKGSHHEGDGEEAIRRARAALAKLDDDDNDAAMTMSPTSPPRRHDDGMKRKNLERCIFIIENWDSDVKGVRRVADDWTNMRTMDESNVPLSWEMVVFDYRSRKNVA